MHGTCYNGSNMQARETLYMTTTQGGVTVTRQAHNLQLRVRLPAQQPLATWPLARPQHCTLLSRRVAACWGPLCFRETTNATRGGHNEEGNGQVHSRQLEGVHCSGRLAADAKYVRVALGLPRDGMYFSVMPNAGLHGAPGASTTKED